ncbi:MAG: hypothetical protein AAFU77_08135 [Myxococcota bacterium]
MTKEHAVQNDAMERAFRLARVDRQLGFYQHPLETELFGANLNDWLPRLAERLDSGEYHPSSATIIDVPKKDWHVRPAAWLCFEDLVAFHYLLLKNESVIGNRLRLTDETTRFSHLLSESPKSWFREGFSGWDNFRRVSLARIDERILCSVVLADITGYYENIDLGILARDLDDIGFEKLSMTFGFLRATRARLGLLF